MGIGPDSIVSLAVITLPRMVLALGATILQLEAGEDSTAIKLRVFLPQALIFLQFLLI